MAYMLVHGPCFSCGRLMSYNADLVPSLRDEAGVRQAICRGCVGIFNENQRKHSRPEFQIPSRAYEAQEVD